MNAPKPKEPGPIWGGWWFWEPPQGKTKEDEPKGIKINE